jgi:3-oxoacyl-[acyl-carrier protein] reductase
MSEAQPTQHAPLSTQQSLADKSALVTGGSRGIGRAIALELARQGARVAINFQARADAAEEVRQQAEAWGAEALVLQGDVAASGDVERMVAAASERFGRIDILVNNAGITRDRLLLRMRDEDWDAVLNTNLRGVFLCTRAVLRGMVRQRSGRIINIGSVAGIVGNPGQANYAAAKAGLMGFTRAIAREVATRSITANVIAPGYIESDMWLEVSDEARTTFLGMVPLGRPGSPEDVAALAAFLASDQAGYITGQVIHVDGGMVMA